MSVIKRDRNGNRMRCFYEVETPPGTGRMIATYDGANQNPLPAFEGEPIGVSLQFATAKEISEFVYDALNKDFRVSVATVLSNGEHHIINRNK